MSEKKGSGNAAAANTTERATNKGIIAGHSPSKREATHADNATEPNGSVRTNGPKIKLHTETLDSPRKRLKRRLSLADRRRWAEDPDLYTATKTLHDQPVESDFDTAKLREPLHTNATWAQPRPVRTEGSTRDRKAQGSTTLLHNERGLLKPQHVTNFGHKTVSPRARGQPGLKPKDKLTYHDGAKSAKHDTNAPLHMHTRHEHETKNEQKKPPKQNAQHMHPTTGASRIANSSEKGPSHVWCKNNALDPELNENGGWMTRGSRRRCFTKGFGGGFYQKLAPDEVEKFIAAWWDTPYRKLVEQPIFYKDGPVPDNQFAATLPQCVARGYAVGSKKLAEKLVKERRARAHASNA